MSPSEASTRKTPQPSPAYHSAVQQIQGGVQEFAGTPDRVSALRGACLIRDRYRCVISRKFDQVEAAARFQKDGDDALDDEGTALRDDPRSFDVLEVAHILPHSLTKTNASSQLVRLPVAARISSLSLLGSLEGSCSHDTEHVRQRRYTFD